MECRERRRELWGSPLPGAALSCPNRRLLPLGAGPRMAGAGRAAGTLEHLLGLLLGSPAPALFHLQGTGPCHVGSDGVRRSLPALGSRTQQDDPTASASEPNLFPSEIIEWSVLGLGWPSGAGARRGMWAGPSSTAGKTGPG